MLAPFGVSLAESRRRFATCLCTLYVRVFQSTAAEMKVGKRWKRNIYFILSPTVLLCFRLIALFFSLFYPFCVFKVKAAASLIICACPCVHVWDRKRVNSAYSYTFCFFLNVHNPSDVTYTFSDSQTNMSLWINRHSKATHWPQERVVVVNVSQICEKFKWINSRFRCWLSRSCRSTSDTSIKCVKR